METWSKFPFQINRKIIFSRTPHVYSDGTSLTSCLLELFDGGKVQKSTQSRAYLKNLSCCDKMGLFKILKKKN